MKNNEILYLSCLSVCVSVCVSVAELNNERTYRSEILCVYYLINDKVQLTFSDRLDIYT